MVSQPFPLRTLDRRKRPLTIRDLPAIPTELKLPQIAGQMLFRDMMERAENATL